MWVLAVAGPALVTLAALPLHSATFRGSFQFSALVLVVTLAVVGGMRPALTSLVLTVLGQAFFVAPPFRNPRVGLLPSAVALAAFAIAGVAVAMLTGRLSHLAAEQAAFRRVALLTAQISHNAPAFPGRQVRRAPARSLNLVMESISKRTLTDRGCLTTGSGRGTGRTISSGLARPSPEAHAGGPGQQSKRDLGLRA
jgi:two-component system sensor histidine kinase KdpD